MGENSKSHDKVCKELIKSDISHLISQFCKDELGWYKLNMVSEPIRLGHPPNYPRIKPNSVRREGHIGENSSPKLERDKVWNELMKSDTPHLTSRFCKDELGSYKNRISHLKFIVDVSFFLFGTTYHITFI